MRMEQRAALPHGRMVPSCSAPLVTRLRRCSGAPRSRALLTSLLDEVGERGQALVLRGEPGIGKSRLLSVAAQTARDRGMTVLTATGVQSEAHLPFAGLHQLLRPVRERAVELPPIQRDALDAAFGLTREVAPEHYRIAMASLDLVSDVAGDAPLLLVVEDAHWLDPPTADVLAFVARRIESDPVVLLAATRDGYPSALTDAGLPEHRLAGLDDTTAAALLDAAAPDLPPAARNRVLREAAGNPLALLELPAVAAPARGRAVGARRPAADRAPRARVRRARLRSARCHPPRAAGRRAQRRGRRERDPPGRRHRRRGTAGSRRGGAGRRGGAHRPRRQLASVSGTRWCAPRSGRAPACSSAAVCTRRSPRRSTPIPTAACGTAPH